MGRAAVKFPKPGALGLALVEIAEKEGVLNASEPRLVTAANRLVGHGYLARDKKDGSVYYPTPRAGQMLEMLRSLAGADTGEGDSDQSATEAVPAVAPSVDASDLVATVRRAMALLDEGDVVNARLVASVAYAQAKTAAQFAEQVGATEKLVAKARRMQADALLIESRAKIIIAERWDDAQAAGAASTGGRPKTVSDGNGFTSDETGLSRKEIHEARKLAAAERREPGIVERAIAARLSAGLEPTRANLRASIGTKTATKEERGVNLYQTPPEAMHTLLALEEFAGCIAEICCGKGAISRMLEAAGKDVILADLEDYETTDRHGELQRVEDFLTSAPYGGEYDIVTNPPYGENLNAIMAHALKVHRPRKMALLLNYNAYLGFTDDDRNYVFDIAPPARVYAFKHRLPMMHRDGWTGPEASSSMNTAWYIWERNDDGSYGARDGWTAIRRVDWKDYQPEAAESEAA